MRKTSYIFVALVIGICIGMILREPNVLSSKSVIDKVPDSITVYSPEGNETIHRIRPVRHGSSHESSDADPSNWRIVMVYSDKIHFYECEHVSTMDQ
jgi:hypothetical protein